MEIPYIHSSLVCHNFAYQKLLRFQNGNCESIRWWETHFGILRILVFFNICQWYHSINIYQTDRKYKKYIGCEVLATSRQVVTSSIKQQSFFWWVNVQSSQLLTAFVHMSNGPRCKITFQVLVNNIIIFELRASMYFSMINHLPVVDPSFVLMLNVTQAVNTPRIWAPSPTRFTECFQPWVLQTLRGSIASRGK